MPMEPAVTKSNLGENRGKVLKHLKTDKNQL